MAEQKQNSFTPPSARLAGKVALITGGASGIGRASALLFAREGALVSIVDVNELGGKDVAHAINQAGGQSLFLPADVTRVADCERVVRLTVEKFGGLHVLFNHAG